MQLGNLSTFRSFDVLSFNFGRNSTSVGIYISVRELTNDFSRRMKTFEKGCTCGSFGGFSGVSGSRLLARPGVCPSPRSGEFHGERVFLRGVHFSNSKIFLCGRFDA